MASVQATKASAMEAEVRKNAAPRQMTQHAKRYIARKSGEQSDAVPSEK
jgi:hypothetical protein